MKTTLQNEMQEKANEIRVMISLISSIRHKIARYVEQSKFAVDIGKIHIADMYFEGNRPPTQMLSSKAKKYLAPYFTLLYSTPAKEIKECQYASLKTP